MKLKKSEHVQLYISDAVQYIKLMMFNGTKKEFSMYAYIEYFKEITKGNIAGQLVYTQESRDGINSLLSNPTKLH